jgi:hypothetical protein
MRPRTIAVFVTPGPSVVVDHLIPVHLTRHSLLMLMMGDGRNKKRQSRASSLEAVDRRVHSENDFSCGTGADDATQLSTGYHNLVRVAGASAPLIRL